MPESILVQILTIVWEGIVRMWWFFLLSALLVGIIKGYRLDMHIRDWMNRAGAAGVVLAVVTGLISPLCSCGILPIVISLAMMGTPIPPLIALLITSPTMAPDAFLITWRGLGPEWALLKLAGATALGLFGGFVALALERRGWFAGEMIRLKPVYREDGSLASAYEIGMANGVPVKTMSIVPRASRLRFILDRSLDAALFTGKFLLLAVVLEAIIVTLVPMSWITVLAGQESFLSVLVASLAGLPLPINQIPAVPVVAGLLQRGMDPGAAFAFLMAGPVSSIPATLALWGMFRPRVVIVFLTVSLGGSMILGWLYQVLT